MNPAARLRSLLPSLALLAAGVFLTQPSARAANTTIIWNGGSSGTFSVSTNWTPNANPNTSTTVAEFTGTGGATYAVNLTGTAVAQTGGVWLNSTGQQTVNFTTSSGFGLNFNGGSTFPIAIETDGNITTNPLAASSLTFGTSSTNLNIAQPNSNAPTVSILINDSSNVTFNGTFTGKTNNPAVDKVAGTGGGSGSSYSGTGLADNGSVTFNGAIQDGNTSTGKTLDLFIGNNTTTNVGQVYLNAANTYTGGTTIGAQTTAATSYTEVFINNASAFGTGAVTFYSGEVTTGTYTLTGSSAIANNFTIDNGNNGTSTGFVGSNNLELSGTLAIATNGYVANNLTTGTTLTVDGLTTAGAAAATFTGAGDTTLSGGYTAGTSLVDNMTGTLTLSKTITISSSGTTFSGTGPITFSPTATLTNASSGSTAVTATFNPGAAETLPVITNGGTAPTAVAISTGSTASASVNLLASTSNNYTGGTTFGNVGTNASPYNVVFNIGGTAGSSASTSYITNLDQLGSTTSPGLTTFNTVNVSNASSTALVFGSQYAFQTNSNSISGGGVNFTGTGSITIGGNYTLPGGNPTYINNSIGGPGALTLNGNVYLGTTSTAANSTITGSGLTIINGSILNSLNAGSGIVDGFNYLGTGTLDLNHVATNAGYTYVGQGNTTVANGGSGEGTIVFGTNEALSYSDPLYLNAGTVNLNGYSQTIVGLVIGGSGGANIGGVGSTASIIVSGSGVVTLTSTNTYNPSNGTSAVAIGLASITNGGGTGGSVALGATNNNFNIIHSTGNATGSPDFLISVPITGSSARHVIKYGNGQMNFSGANTYTGITTIDNGILNVATVANGASTANGLGESSNVGGNLTFGGGTLQYSDYNALGSAQSTDRLFTIGDADTLSGQYSGLPTATIDSSASSSSDTITFSNTGSVLFAATGTGTNTNPTALANSTLTLTGSNTGLNTFDPLLSDPSGSTKTSLVKSGTGTWVINNTNTYSGGTTISGGILMTSASGALGSTSGALADNSGGTLDLDGTSQTVGAFTGAGTVLNSAATSTATLSVIPASATDNNFSGVIEDNGGSGGSVAFTVAGTGTQTLSGANTYSGGTTITSGTLQTATGGTLGSTSGALVDNATLDLDGTNQSVGAFTGTTVGKVLNSAVSTTSILTVGTGSTGTSTFSGVIENNAGMGGTVAFTKAGTGTEVFNGANTYTGTTTVNAGILQVGDGTSGTIASTSPVVVGSGGTFAVNEASGSSIGNTITSSGTVEGNENSGHVNTITSGITGGAFVQAGTGTTVLTGSSSFSSTTLNAGTVQLGDGTSGHNGSLGTNAVTVNSGTTLAVNQYGNSTVANNIVNNGTTTLATTSTGTLSLTGNISGTTGALNQTAGTTVLSGNNGSYTGSTTVSGGTMTIASSTALTDGSISVGSGGTFLFSASGNSENGANVTLSGGNLSFGTLTGATETLGSLTLTANSTITFGGAGSGDTLTFTNLSLGTYTLTVDDWSGQKYYYSGYTGPGVSGANGTTNDPGTDTAQDRLLFTGSTSPVTTSDLGNSQVQFYDDSGNFINNGKVVSYEGGPDSELVPAPEPSTCVMALGLVLLAAYRERRRLAGFVPAWLKL